VSVIDWTSVDGVDMADAFVSFDVLNAKHNMREQIAESFGRRGQLLDSVTSRRDFDDHATLPFPVRSFQWTCPDRASITTLRAFLDARKGRLNPFWVPTCCWDLQLTANVGVSATDLFIARAGYLDFLFPKTCRRYLAIFPPGGASVYLRKVTACVANDAVSEKITIDTGIGVALPAAGTVISFLVLCRLADDLTSITWLDANACEAAIKFVELPLEVPA
jgi:hypothetical protein